MHANVTMYYPSIPTTYYATGQWLEDQTEFIPSKHATYRIVDKGKKDERLKFSGSSLKTENVQIEIFRGQLCLENNHDKLPSCIQDRFWLQAKVPQKIYSRLLYITNNSGRFVINIENDLVDIMWKRFLRFYEFGILGYGMQCQTACYDNKLPYKSILVFTEDAFDLTYAAKIAWMIDKVMDDWKGNLYYWTDRSIKAKYLPTKIPFEEKALYTISSFDFKNSVVGKPVEKKEFSEFIDYFVKKFRKCAQERQKNLYGKHWDKFLRLPKETSLDLSFSRLVKWMEKAS